MVDIRKENMAKKKVGIISYYCGSYNYGGLLQAYALTKFLNQFDNFKVEQICYKVLHEHNTKTTDSAFRKVLAGIYHLPKRLYFNYGKKATEQALEQRKIKISKWRERIPHSNKVFTIHTIGECAEYYDCFITGSDQVWNMRWCDSSYFLDFVPKSKCRFSYGASIGDKSISRELEQLLSKNVSTFNGISVREASSKTDVSNICCRKVEVVVDPTLLLTKEQWDDVCSERQIKQRYIFCYFLGNDIVMRKIAKQFARERDCLLVTLPHAPLDYMPCDRGFGDIPLYNIDPSDFLSLIKYADYIFTDSFHASVFSNLYQKKFIVFERSGMLEMGNRIEDLCKLFHNQYRFYRKKDKVDINQVQSILEVEQASEHSMYLEEKEKSEHYLEEQLRSISC